MQLRRPIAALVTALVLFGGGAATLTGCGDPAGTDRSDGTTDTGEDSESGDDRNGLPNNSDPDQGNEEDQNDDSTDPD